jgi:hypothetical protein
MPNASFTGFWPYGNAGSTSTQLMRRRAASNNGTAFFFGDCSVYTAAGVVGLATAGAGITTVFQGAEYFDSSINSRRFNPYLPVSTTYSGTAFDDWGNTDETMMLCVADPVNTRFQAQYSASTPAQTDLTKNANFSAGTGSTTTGISGHVLDQTTIATTLTLDLRIQDLKRNVFNDPTIAAQAKVIVQINNGRVPPFGTSAPGSVGI